MKLKPKKILKLGQTGDFQLVDAPETKASKAKFNFSILSQASEIGFSIALPIVAGALFGLWLDNKLSSKPLFILIGMLLGILVAFYSMFVIVREFSKKPKH